MKSKVIWEVRKAIIENGEIKRSVNMLNLTELNEVHNIIGRYSSRTFESILFTKFPFSYNLNMRCILYLKENNYRCIAIESDEAPCINIILNIKETIAGNGSHRKSMEYNITSYDGSEIYLKGNSNDAIKFIRETYKNWFIGWDKNRLMHYEGTKIIWD